MGDPDEADRRDATPGVDKPIVGAGPTAPPGPPAETRGARAARKARRVWLYLMSFVALAVLVFLVALIAKNTEHVRVSWVFGTSRVSLVWLVVFAAVLGWLLGLLVGALFHRRTRRRDPQKGAESRTPRAAAESGQALSGIRAHSDCRRAAQTVGAAVSRTANDATTGQWSDGRRPSMRACATVASPTSHSLLTRM